MSDPKYKFSAGKGPAKSTTIKDLEAMHPGLKYSKGKIGGGPVTFTYKDDDGKEYGYSYDIDSKTGMSNLVPTGPISKAPITVAPKINQSAVPAEKKQTVINPITTDAVRKPLVFGTGGYSDPNTGQTYSYDAQYKEKEIEPNVQNYKRGGVVGKVRGYAEGGMTKEQVDLAKEVIGVGGGLANQWATKEEAEAMRSDGTIEENRYRNVGAARGAAQGAQIGTIGLNPLLLGATGGLSALAVPAGALIGGGIGAAVGKKRGEKINQEIDYQKRVEEGERQAGIHSQNLAKAKLDSSQGLKDGGDVKGAGTAKSDSIRAKVKAGSFVVPAENADKAKAVRKTVLNAPSLKKKANLKQKNGEDVRLSNGEHLFTPEEKEEIIKELGEEFLYMLAPNAEDKDEMAEGGLTRQKAKKILHDGSVRGHQLTEKQRKYMGAIASGYKCGGKVKGYKEGGPVKGQKIQYKGEEVTFDGKNWINKDGSIKYKAEISDEYFKEKAKEDERYGKQQVDSWKRHYDLIKDDPKRADEAKRTLDKINKVTGKTSGPTKAEEKPTSDVKVKKAPAVRKVAPETMQSKTPELTVSKTDEAELLPSGEEIVSEQVTKTETPKSGSKKIGSELLKEGVGLASKASSFAAPYYQAQQGLKFLSSAGKRPVDRIDPEYLQALERAKSQAQFGYTGAEQALIDQKNIAALRSGEGAARMYSGGSGANAYAMQRQAAGDYFGRGLEAAIRGKQLQMEKQQYADQMGTQKAAMSRRLFDDNLTAWNQKQQSGAELLGAGLSNAVAAKRYNDELSFLNKLRGEEGNWMKNITG